MSEGLENTFSGRKNIYLSIINSLFAQRVDKDTPNAVPRLLSKGVNAGSEVYELLFNKVTGKITNIKERESKFGNTFQITIEATIKDEERILILDLPVSSSHCTSFLMRFPNIDLSEKVSLLSYSFEDENKKQRSGISVFQNNEKILPYFTAEEKNGLPELEKKVFKGKTVYDDTLRIEYFRKMILSKFSQNEAPKFSQNEAPKESQNEENSEKVPF